MANHPNASAGNVLGELRRLLISETLTTDTINSDSGFQSNLAALLNTPAIIPSTHLASFLTSLSTLNHELRSACTQFFAMDLFAFISRSACVPSDDPTWSDSECTALDFVTVTMLQDDRASAREMLLAVQQRLMQVRAKWVEAMDASGGDVGYESASEEEDEAQGGEQVDEEEEQPLDRQAVFVLICGLHAYYHAMASPTAKKRSASLHSDLLSAWLPLRALTSSPACARLFLSSASAITARLLSLTDTTPQSFTLRILGHFVGLLPASDPLVQHQVELLKSLPNLIDTLVPSVAVEDHILVALVLPTTQDCAAALANTHFDSLLDTIGGLMLSPVHQHWHLAHSLLAHLATLPPATPSTTPVEPVGDFVARHWLPFLSTHCTDPTVRALVARAGNELLSTHLTEAEQATVLAALVHASPFANGKCMLIGSLLQPRVAANPAWAGGWTYVREALVPSMQRDVGALVDVLAGGGGGGEGEGEVAGHMMVVLAWVQFAYVLVKGGADEDAKEVLRSVVVGPLARLDERGMVPPVVGFAVGGLREALGDDAE